MWLKTSLKNMKYQTHFLINCQECFTNERFSKYFHLIMGFAFSNLPARELRYTKIMLYLPKYPPRALEAYLNNKVPLDFR